VISCLIVSRSEWVKGKREATHDGETGLRRNNKMYAVIETGGKQYRVSQGDVICVEKLNAEVGEKIEFDKVLILGAGDSISVGTPYLNSVVTGNVVESGKGEKVIIYKYKSKKDYRKKQGHRQPYTKVEITGLGTAPSADADTASDESGLPNFKNMKKAEIIEFAKANNIEIDEKATIAVLIETISAAIK